MWELKKVSSTGRRNCLFAFTYSLDKIIDYKLGTGQEVKAKKPKFSDPQLNMEVHFYEK